MKITRRGGVESYQLGQGENEGLLCENAYVMIEGIYKRKAGKAVQRKSPNVAPGYARSYNWDDGIQQEEFIQQIYLGKENPEFATPKAVRNQVAEDIGVKDSQPTRMRQAHQRA